jgi:hypothetical protein
VLRDHKQVWIHEGKSSVLLKGTSDVLAIGATPTSGLLSMEPTMAIEVDTIDFGTGTKPQPCSPSIVDFKSQLEAKEVFISCLQEDVQKLLCETKEKSLAIAKQVEEIHRLYRLGSHAFAMDDIQGPIDVEAHAQDTNILVENNVKENVVATITARVLEDICTLVCKRPSVVLPPPSPTIQSLNMEGTQDSLLFPLFSIANDIHVPSEPTSQVQDPPNLNKII